MEAVVFLRVTGWCILLFWALWNFGVCI